MLQVTILGCGPALGVPVIGCKCYVCLSDNYKNKRLRSAIHLKSKNSSILVDFGCDIRTQLIREKIFELDAAILTHAHADHCNGIDDLRVFPFLQNKSFPIYTTPQHLKIIKRNYEYLFNNKKLELKSIAYDASLQFPDFKINFFEQNHGDINSTGLRINDFVYSNDVLDFPKNSYKYLQNINIWVLDCIQLSSTQAHSGLEKILEWNKVFQPKWVYLTNMNHTLDYEELLRSTPENFFPLYDGYKIMLD